MASASSEQTFDSKPISTVVASQYKKELQTKKTRNGKGLTATEIAFRKKSFERISANIDSNVAAQI